MSIECVICGTVLSGKQQKYCGNNCKQKHHYDRVKFQTNTYHSQTVRSLKRKRRLIKMNGGGCNKCGYNTNYAALEFHHVDSSKKEFKLDMRMLSNRSWERILTEADKCILLCANCHATEHHPELSSKNVDLIITSASRGKRRDEQGVNSGKPSLD